MQFFEIVCPLLLYAVFLIKIAEGQTSEIMSLVGRWAEGPCNAVSVSGNFIYKGSGSLIYILDISGEGVCSTGGEILLLVLQNI